MRHVFVNIIGYLSIYTSYRCFFVVSKMFTLFLVKLFILLLLCYLIVNLQIIYTRLKYRHFNKIYYPLSLVWFLGVVPDVKRRQAKGNMSIAKVFQEYYHETGWDVFVVHLFTRNILVVHDLVMVRRVLTDLKSFNKNRDTHKLMNHVAGVRLYGERGIAAEPGSKVWYTKRRLMEPAFHKEFLKRIIPELNDIGDKLVRILEPRAGTDEVFDIHPSITLSALEAVARCGFAWAEKEIEENKDATLDFTSLVVIVLGKLFMERFTFHLPHKHRNLKKKFRESLLKLRSKTREIIMKRLEKYSDLNSDLSGKNDVFHYILKGNTWSGKVDIEDVIDDYALFLGAGMETTAITMSLTIFYLTVYPEIYAKVMAELDNVCNGKEFISFEDINNMVYLESVLKECLRMKPPVQGTGRECVKENVVVDRYPIPKGSFVFISQNVLQKDPRYWKDPEIFNPDRFHPTNGDKVHPFTYMPFMLGPRSCIAKNFAMLEAKMIVCKLLQKYKFVNPNPTIKDVVLTGDITHRAVDGVNIILKRKVS